MLQRIREHATGWLSILLLALLALAFAFWGINFQFDATPAVAKVNGEELPDDQIRRAYRNQLSSYQQFYTDGIPPVVEQQVRETVLSQFVRNELMSQITRDEGYRISDVQVVEYVSTMAPFQDQGQFSLDLYRARLASSGQSPSQFEAQIKRALRVSQFRDSVMQSAFVTPYEVKRRAALENQVREVALLTISAQSIADELQVEEAAIAEEYESNKARYVVPETVDIEYLEVSRAALGADVEITEAAVRDRYEEAAAGGLYQTPEQRRSRHILVAIDDDTDDAAAQALAEDLTRRVVGGEDIAALAAEFSDDPGSKKEGGLLDWATRDAFVGAFRDALFGLEAGGVAGPVRTEFGYHVIQLEEVRDGQDKSFDEVRAELEQQMRDEAGEAQFLDLADQLDEFVYENPDSLELAADQFELPLQTEKGISRGFGPGVGSNARVRETIFSDRVLNDGLNSGAVEIGEDSVVFVRVVNRTPQQQKSLEEVRTAIEIALRRDLARKKAEQTGQAAIERLRAGEAPATVAEDIGAAFNETRAIQRADAVLPRPAVTAAFAAPHPADGSPRFGGVELVNGDYSVYVLTAVKAGAAPDESQLKQLASQTGAVELNAYVEALVADSDVVVRSDLLE